MAISRTQLIGIAIILISAYACLWFLGDLRNILTLEMLQTHQQSLRQQVSDHYYLSVVLYIIVYTAHSALALPATSLLLIAGGLLFGIPAGMLYAFISSLIGGTSAFLFARLLFGTALQRRYTTQLAHFHAQFMRHHSKYLLMVRCIPIIPFCLVNILSGLALVPLKTFIWTLALGILPSLYLYTSIGTELSMMHSPWDLLNYNMMITGLLIIACICIPILYTRAIQHQSE